MVKSFLQGCLIADPWADVRLVGQRHIKLESLDISVGFWPELQNCYRWSLDTVYVFRASGELGRQTSLYAFYLVHETKQGEARMEHLYVTTLVS